MQIHNKTNYFFNNYNSSKEQHLLNSLISESISIFGESMYYCPRTINSLNTLYTEDAVSSYEKSFLVPIYIENVMGFKGDGEYIAKFGIEIRNRIVLSISQSVFAMEIGTLLNTTRPNEGDLIYFPLNDKCFQIKYVEKFEMFYPLGALYVWKMECELFEYSSEIMNTGIPQIDSLQTQFDLNVIDWAIRTEEGYPILDENYNYICIDGSAVGQKYEADISDELEEKAQDIIDFSVIDPFSSGFIGTTVSDVGLYILTRNQDTILCGRGDIVVFDDINTSMTTYSSLLGSLLKIRPYFGLTSSMTVNYI
jgi:hypothetical protein